MESLRSQLRGMRWGLPLARVIAGEVGESKAVVRALGREVFGEDVEVRKRAADVARGGYGREGRGFGAVCDWLSRVVGVVSGGGRGGGVCCCGGGAGVGA